MNIHDYLRVDKVAERMGRPRAWLSVRLNGTFVNGKPSFFTPDELEEYKRAINDIAVDIMTAARELKVDKNEK